MAVVLSSLRRCCLTSSLSYCRPLRRRGFSHATPAGCAMRWWHPRAFLRLHLRAAIRGPWRYSPWQLRHWSPYLRYHSFPSLVLSAICDVLSDM
uniref:Uncharacterized protein n=1 Tax=Arundo donax TaxID=35708 RepID=A0A0A9D0T0_ARUDO